MDGNSFSSSNWFRLKLELFYNEFLPRSIQVSDILGSHLMKSCRIPLPISDYVVSNTTTESGFTCCYLTSLHLSLADSFYQLRTSELLKKAYNNFQLSLKIHYYKNLLNSVSFASVNKKNAGLLKLLSL